MQETVVGVRFTKVGKIYHFDASHIPDLKLGDAVVVETSRGWQLGKIAQILRGEDIPSEENRKAIDRVATPRDLLIRQNWQKKEASVIEETRKRVIDSGITGIKIVAAEYSFDGTRLSILFNSEADEKADVKNLRQDMQKMYSPAQVELRQIGPRDVAKILGGMGACGLENRCCSKFLTDFSSISIRMAKEQNISLTPTEITGMCGRLRCCLIYEYEQYVEARKQLPKKNKRVMTPQGEGRVVDVLILKESVIVEIPEIGYREFTKAEVEPAEELERLKQKAQNPCGEDGGGCGGACGTKKG
jgi:cell fate regulator YaaT (PSP1 superfamily)